MDKNQLFVLLKAKAKQYGFDKDEMSEVVDTILQNSQLTEEATEDEWNAQIDAVLPFLGVGQKMANRISKAQKKEEEPPKNTPANKDVKPKDDDSSTKKDSADNGNEALLSIMKAMKDEMASLKGEISSFKAQKVADTRKQRLTKILDAETAFGKSTLKSFERLTFNSDEDFDDYLNEIEEVAKSIKQTDNDKKLDSMGSKPLGGAKKDPSNQATDKEIEALVGKM